MAILFLVICTKTNKIANNSDNLKNVQLCLFTFQAQILQVHPSKEAVKLDEVGLYFLVLDFTIFPDLSSKYCYIYSVLTIKNYLTYLSCESRSSR